MQAGDVCLSLSSNSIHRHVIVSMSLSTQVCDFLKLRLKIWLVLEGDFVKKNGETLTMVLSLQGLYNSFICLLNKYTLMDCKGLTNVTFPRELLTCLSKHLLLKSKMLLHRRVEKGILECAVQKHHLNGSACK